MVIKLTQPRTIRLVEENREPDESRAATTRRMIEIAHFVLGRSTTQPAHSHSFQNDHEPSAAPTAGGDADTESVSSVNANRANGSDRATVPTSDASEKSAAPL